MQPHRPRSLPALLAFFVALVLAACATTAGSSEPIHVVLLHTNDMHGQAQPRAATWIDREDPPPIGGLPRVAAYVNTVRRGFAGERGGVLVVDAGDVYQGTPEGLIDEGRGFVSAVAEVGYDAICVGNHDLDRGIASLAAKIEDFDLPMVAANLYVREGGPRVDWVEPWRIVELGGLRIGVVGLLTPVTPSITHGDARTIFFEDPAVALRKAREELAGEVDWILVLAHEGVDEDERLAAEVPDLDVIVGGHSHTYLKEGLLVGRTHVLQAGSKTSAVGRADLWFDAESEELVDFAYRVVDLLEEPTPETENPAVTAICADLVLRSELEMQQVVGTLGADLTRAKGRFESSTAGNLITDLMRERVGAQVAIQNRGGIRCDLRAGPVTRRNLFELLPFGNHLVLLEVTGETLLSCLIEAVEGRAHSGLELGGMVLRYRLDDEGEASIASVLVGGEPVEPTRTYTLATNSFLAEGRDGYDALGTSKRLREDTLMLRELLEERLRSGEPVVPATDQRYELVD